LADFANLWIIPKESVILSVDRNKTYEDALRAKGVSPKKWNGGVDGPVGFGPRRLLKHQKNEFPIVFGEPNLNENELYAFQVRILLYFQFFSIFNFY
jgi:hypothetical protein